MSFLKYQKQTPEFLNNYLKYKAFIEFKSKTTIDETYFDLRTLLRYIKLLKTDKDKIYTITIDEFKKISIIDITLEDLNNITPNNLEKYIIFLNNILTNDIKTRNRKLASLKKFFEYLETNNFISLNPSKNMTSGRVEKRIPKHLSLIESKQLLSNVIKSNNRFKIINIEEINNNINRETGNNVITQVSQTIKDKLQSEYIFVRYMGPKFAIIFSGIDPQSAEEILKEIKESVEELKISPVENNENQDYGIYARAKLNFAVAAYYKGTALEEVMRRLEEYLDNADKEENSINFL